MTTADDRANVNAIVMASSDNRFGGSTCSYVSIVSCQIGTNHVEESLQETAGHGEGYGAGGLTPDTRPSFATGSKNPCACNCGQLVRGTWARGHNRRSLLPNVRYAYSMPVQRVLPLVEFLFHEHGTNAATARAIGCSEYAVRRWLGRAKCVRRVSPSSTARIVAAVASHEAQLRMEADQDVRAEGARQRARQRAEGVTA